MRPITSRYVVLFVVFTLLATVTASGISYVYSSHQFKNTTERQLTESAISYGFELNEIIFGIETAVNTVTENLEVVIDPTRIESPAYYNEIQMMLEGIATKFDDNVINATSFYIRFDPKRSSGTAGVFHADINGDNLLEFQPPTDISMYSPSDREHVGWFYEPMTFTKGDWMKPYYNANIRTYMVSYVAPIIIDNVTIGIVGMDVDFVTLKKIADAHKGAGKVVLIDRDHAFMVHPQYTLNDRLDTIDEGALYEISEMMFERKNGTVHYQLEGVQKVLGFMRLRNDWTVIVTLTEEEAFLSFNETTSTLLKINLMVSTVITGLAFLFSNYVYRLIMRTTSLEKLVEERTQQLTDTNSYLEETVAELENKQAELLVLNNQLEESIQIQNEMQDRLIETEKLASLGELVAGISHELNTPVGNAILLNSYAKEQLDEIKLQAEQPNLKSSDLIEFITRLTEAFELSQKTLIKISDLVQHFKLMTQPEQLIDIQKFVLIDYLRTLAKNYEEVLSVSNHQIKIEGDERLTVISSPAIIGHVINQLIDNSLNHGFEGLRDREIIIQVTAHRGLIRMIYTDNGKGLAKEIIGKVFNPFVSTKKNKGYVGLGLHMVFNLITQTLHGSIKMNPSVETGFSVIIEFEEFKNLSES